MSRGSTQRRALVVLATVCAVVFPAGVALADSDGSSRFLRFGVQAGPVLATNDFLRGDNLSGEPIDTFTSVRLEFGWQTDGSQDWHHVFNFPSYGLGLYGADFDNDAEVGNPTSLYGFFTWPVTRRGRWDLDFDLDFGLTSDWKAYDAVTNPKNVAMGLGRSVHIELGLFAGYRFDPSWSLRAGVTATHFSNGGSQRPNHGINQIGPMVMIGRDLDPRPELPARRRVEFEPAWDLSVTASLGRRNLDLRFEDPELRERYGNRDYRIANLTVVAGRRFGLRSRAVFGVDLAHDPTVSDLIEIDAFENGTGATADTSDEFELAAVAGYEIFAHRTHVLLHLAHKLAYEDAPGRLPAFYQRLGVRHFVFGDAYVGLNVRFHEIGSADNLEWNAGYAFGLGDGP